MAESPDRDSQRHNFELRSRAESNLSSLVMTIEFTLISVIAGVVLAPLADHAKDVLVNLQFEYWPYIMFGLLYILFMWSGVISHSFTFVGWPFELGHNLFYIVWALVQAMQVTFLQAPVAWFALNFVQFLVAGAIGFYDLRILQRRANDARGEVKKLYDLALIRQGRLLRLFPVAAGSSAVSLILILAFPDVFIAQHAHWLLGCLQILVAAGGVVHNARSLNLWQEQIVRKAMAELERED